MGFQRSACAAAQAGDLLKLTRIIQRNPEAVRCDGSAGSSGYTPLHYAARAGKLDCVLFLLSKGSAVDALTREGRSSSLHRAAALGHLPVVRALLAAGADSLLQDADGESGLHKAAAQGHAAVCSHLLGVSPQAAHLTDKRGLRPRQRATGSLNHSVMQKNRCSPRVQAGQRLLSQRTRTQPLGALEVSRGMAIVAGSPHSRQG
ncbi:MAG: hypothetical protein WDW38_008930 [Sanguina aurantia]